MDEESRVQHAERLRSMARQTDWIPRDLIVLPPDAGSQMLFALARVVQATGECRVGPGEAILVPILEKDGLRWECSHPNPHRSEVVVPRAL